MACTPCDCLSLALLSVDRRCCERSEAFCTFFMPIPRLAYAPPSLFLSLCPCRCPRPSRSSPTSKTGRRSFTSQTPKTGHHTLCTRCVRASWPAQLQQLERQQHAGELSEQQQRQHLEGQRRAAAVGVLPCWGGVCHAGAWPVCFLWGSHLSSPTHHHSVHRLTLCAACCRPVPHIWLQATRMFVSNLNQKMSQRFLVLVLLPHVRSDIRRNRRLHFALFQVGQGSLRSHVVSMQRARWRGRALIAAALGLRLKTGPSQLPACPPPAHPACLPDCSPPTCCLPAVPQEGHLQGCCVLQGHPAAPVLLGHLQPEGGSHPHLCHQAHLHPRAALGGSNAAHRRWVAATCRRCCCC